MKVCTGCRRHVRSGERACPFCGEALHAGEAPRLGAVVLLGALGAACVLGPYSDSASGESSGGETGGASTTSGATTGGASTGAGANTTGTTSTGELSGSNDVDGGDTGCAFYGCPVDVGTSVKQCSQWEQDCPDGEKCAAYSGDGDSSWESLKCVPVAPNPGQPGDPCQAEGSGVSGIDDCDVGAMCWNTDSETLVGVCVALCTGSPDQPMCAEPGTACLIANDGVLTPCLPTCDPLAQDCAAKELCVASGQDPGLFLCTLDASGDEGQEFDVCEYANACDAGLYCANPELAVECELNAGGCCLPWCDLTMPACNGAGAQCLPWFAEDQVPPPGLENVGICGIPA